MACRIEMNELYHKRGLNCMKLRTRGLKWVKYVAERVEIVKIITDMVKWRVEMTESFGREG